MKPDRSHGPIGYRPEIDGLRALAVLPVILFHAGIPWFQGGFIGVDVFFVISGYLITSIIGADLSNGRFTLATFYERRARRILPALFLVVAVCVPFAYFWMLPVELVRFGRSLLATLAFVPNLYFWRETSYFSPAAEEEPLLHMWSLGVEEQFYLLFPLLLWVLWGKGLRQTFLVTLALAVASFAISEWGWRAGKLSSNFFLPYSRAWELLIGALLAITWRVQPIYERVSATACNILSALGLAMLSLAVVLFDRHVPTPSVYALAPTIGTALIIAFSRKGTITHTVLSQRLLVGIGLVSYSAYLWHQPLFAFYRIRVGELHSPPMLLALVVLTLVLAWFTWRFIEVPARSTLLVPRTVVVRVSMVCVILLALVGLATEVSKGLEDRLSPTDRQLAEKLDTVAQGRYVTARFFSMLGDFDGGAPGTKILVIGDSYAQDLVNVIAESKYVRDSQIRTHYISWDCQIYLGESDVSNQIERKYRKKCAKEHNSVPIFAKARDADVILLAGSWRQWAVERLPATIASLRQNSNAHILVVGPKHTGEVKVRDLLLLPEHERLAVSKPVSNATIEMERLLRLTVSPENYVSMQTAVCGIGAECRQLTPEGGLISFDGWHLTREGAQYAARNLFALPPMSNFSASGKN